MLGHVCLYVYLGAKSEQAKLDLIITLAASRISHQQRLKLVSETVNSSQRTHDRELNHLRMNYRFEKITFPLYEVQVASHV